MIGLRKKNKNTFKNLEWEYRNKFNLIPNETQPISEANTANSYRQYDKMMIR